MKNKFILIVLLLVAIFGILGFWYYQRNIYSKEVLKLEILGPGEIGLAEVIEYTVKYKNNGHIRLEEPRLVFEFPKHAILEKEQSLRQEILLDDIYPGQEKTLNFKGRLLGKEGEVKTARAYLSYRPKNLKARYEAETSHATQIKLVSLTLEFDLPSKIESGKEISFRLNYFSNTNYPLSNLGIKIEYPAGFEFLRAKPSAIGQSEWEIGLLNKAEGGRIEILGNLAGGLEEEKLFRAQLGSWQDGEFVLLKEALRAVRIVTPSLYISQLINSSPQYVANPGDTLHYEIFFKNIGEEPFPNLFLVIKLEGKAFDFQTLKAPLGEFEVGDNSVVFDWRRVSDLQFLDAQEEGKVEFWIDLKKEWGVASPQDFNPTITNRVYLGQARQDFATKVNSKIDIVQKGYYQDEVFGNSGPIPPEAGKITTYTVIWQAKNHYNDVKNAKVKAVLGKGVSLTGRIFPEDSRFTFDSNSKEVVWELGSLAAGKGVFDPEPNLAFQVSFSPQLSQKGAVAELIGKARIFGEDEFTGLTIEGQSLLLNTSLPDDEKVETGGGIIK